MRAPTLILDNGSYMIKAAMAGTRVAPISLLNFSAKLKKGGSKQTLFGSQMLETSPSSLSIRQPTERGLVVNWNVETEIWSHLFENVLKIDPGGVGLLCTDPLLSPAPFQEIQQQIVFEEYGFAHFCRVPASVLALRSHTGGLLPPQGAPPGSAAVVIDVGHAATTVTPMLNGIPINTAIRRVDFGGRALTNYLKELISFRFWDVQDEWLLVGRIKERLCRCSLDFSADMALCRQRTAANSIAREYVMPDYQHDFEGHSRIPVLPPDVPLPHKPAEVIVPSEKDMVIMATRHPSVVRSASSWQFSFNPPPPANDSSSSTQGPPPPASMMPVSPFTPQLSPPAGVPGEQVLRLNNETITVPEILFRPADAGLPQGGIAEAVVEAVEAAPALLRGPLYRNILVHGGTARLPGFRERLIQELRPLVADVFTVDVRLAGGEGADPMSAAVRGGAAWVTAEGPAWAPRWAVSRQEYEEWGHTICRRRFAYY